MSEVLGVDDGRSSVGSRGLIASGVDLSRFKKLGVDHESFRGVSTDPVVVSLATRKAVDLMIALKEDDSTVEDFTFHNVLVRIADVLGVSYYTSFYPWMSIAELDQGFQSLVSTFVLSISSAHALYRGFVADPELRLKSDRILALFHFCIANPNSKFGKVVFFNGVSGAFSSSGVKILLSYIKSGVIDLNASDFMGVDAGGKTNTILDEELKVIPLVRPRSIAIPEPGSTMAMPGSFELTTEGETIYSIDVDNLKEVFDWYHLEVNPPDELDRISPCLDFKFVILPFPMNREEWVEFRKAMNFADRSRMSLEEDEVLICRVGGQRPQVLIVPKSILRFSRRKGKRTLH